MKSEESPSPPRHRARRDAAPPAERRPRLLEIGGVVYERDETKDIIECDGKRYKPVKRVGVSVPDDRPRADDGPYEYSPSLPQSPNAAREDPGPHAGELDQYSRSPSEDASVQERDWAHHQPLTPPRRAPQTSPHALSLKSKAGPPMRKQATPIGVRATSRTEPPSLPPPLTPRQPSEPPPGWTEHRWQNEETIEVALDILRGRQLLAVEQAKARPENSQTPKEQIAMHLRLADGGLFHPERLMDAVALTMMLDVTYEEVKQAIAGARPPRARTQGGTAEKRNILKAIVNCLGHIERARGQLPPDE